MLTRSQSMRHFNLRLNARRTKVLAVLTLLGGGAYYKVSTDEGLRRVLTFNSTATVPLIKYRYYDWKTKDWPEEKRHEVFQRLHERYAPVAVNTILNLKGFYIKLGQLFSGGDGVLPKEYVDAFKVFQSNCPTRPVKEVVETIEAELGRPFHEVFLSIDPVPLGSASIGQVHRARLLSGEEVAVKVQHPSAEKFFRLDVATSRAFCRVAQPEQLALFDEIEKQFVSEFDYTLEAKNLSDVNEVLNSSKAFKDHIVVPKPIMATRKVLVMTFVKGQTLLNQQKQYLRELSEKEKKPVEEIEKELKEKVEKGELPKPPSQAVLGAYRAALRSRDYVRNGFAFAYNNAFGKWTGAPIEYTWSELPMDALEALRLLYEFNGYSIFHHGIFSSDPHGGNVMHVQGEKLGLIDMGQVKRLDVKDRVKLAKLVLALAKDDNSLESNKKIANLWRDCGYRTKHNNDEIIADLARVYFDRLTSDVVDKYGGVAVAIENMQKIDPELSQPDDFIMPMRMSILIRMNAMNLGHGLTGGLYSRVSPKWAPYAKEFLREQGELPEEEDDGDKKRKRARTSKQ